MSCPYLTQITVVFCRAVPVKKFVPTDRLTTASTCEGDCYLACQTYREALEHAGQGIREYEAEASGHGAAKKGVQS
jgi:hypothetical protein